MPGLNGCNRRRPEQHKMHRQRTAKRRSSLNKARVSARLPMVQNAHHRKMLSSNPQANLEMSKKKLKKVERLQRLARGDLKTDVEMGNESS